MGVSLAKTAEVWKAASSGDDELIDRLESIILRHIPTSGEEAATMLDVVAASVSTGERCDGLDIVAISTVASWLRGFGQEADESAAH